MKNTLFISILTSWSVFLIFLGVFPIIFKTFMLESK